MTIDFIFFGIILILLAFGFLKCRNAFVFLSLLIFSLLVVVGYFVPNLNGKFFSFNILHLIALLMAFILLNYKYKVNLYSSIVVSLFYYSLLSFNSNFLMIYNVNWFSVLILFPCLPYLYNPIIGFANLFNNALFILVVDSLFEYNEFNYATINFEVVFKIAVLYLLISIIANLLNKFTFEKRRFVGYEKNDYIITFDTSSI